LAEGGKGAEELGDLVQTRRNWTGGNRTDGDWPGAGWENFGLGSG